MMTPSSAPRPAPPADSGTCVLTSPSSHAALKMSCGKAIERSYSRARGSITSRAKERASDCTASWSGESAKQRPGEAAVESARRAAAAARSIVARAGWGWGVRVGGARGARQSVEVRGCSARRNKHEHQNRKRIYIAPPKPQPRVAIAWNGGDCKIRGICRARGRAPVRVARRLRRRRLCGRRAFSAAQAATAPAAPPTSPLFPPRPPQVAVTQFQTPPVSFDAALLALIIIVLSAILMLSALVTLSIVSRYALFLERWGGRGFLVLLLGVVCFNGQAWRQFCAFLTIAIGCGEGARAALVALQRAARAARGVCIRVTTRPTPLSTALRTSSPRACAGRSTRGRRCGRAVAGARPRPRRRRRRRRRCRRRRPRQKRCARPQRRARTRSRLRRRRRRAGIHEFDKRESLNKTDCLGLGPALQRASLPPLISC